VTEGSRHFVIKLKVNKTTRDVRGLLQLGAALERSKLSPEARAVFLRLKALWRKNYSPERRAGGAKWQ